MKNKLRSIFSYSKLSSFLLLVGVISISFFYSLSKVRKSPNFVTNATDIEVQQVSKMTLDAKIAQLFIIGAKQLDDSLKRLEYINLYNESKIGGFVIYECLSNSLAAFTTSIKRNSANAIQPFIAIDAEFGAAQRVVNIEHFPTQLTLGANNDAELTGEIAKYVAAECKELGVNMVFGPVAEVLHETGDDALNFRSYGSNINRVIPHLTATISAYEEAGVLSILKHYPGYTLAGSHPHKTIQSINLSATEVANETKTFIAGFNMKASGVMVGHVNYKALDAENMASFSSKIINDVLRKGNGFQGLIISDALDVPVITSKFTSGQSAVNALNAGCDILLSPENLDEAKSAIKKAIESNELSIAEIDAKVTRILKAKNYSKARMSSLTKFSKTKIAYAKQKVFEESVTILKNTDKLLPLARLDKKIAYISVSGGGGFASEMVQNFTKPDFFYVKDGKEALARFKDKLAYYDIVITAVNAQSHYPTSNYGMPKGWKEWLAFLPKEKSIALIFGNPMGLKQVQHLQLPNAVICGYENEEFAQKAAIQILFGAQEARGKLPLTINENFKEGDGINFQANGRLKFTLPEELGFAASKFDGIDKIALNGIAQKAFPGCQVVVALKGKVIYQKSFGKHTYENERIVNNTDMYDIASVTKIAASTIALMHLQSNGKFSLNSELKDYLPYMTDQGKMGKINLKAMMAHQAGFFAWVPFYKRTVKNGALSSSIYSKVKTDEYQYQVADSLFIKPSYKDSMYAQIYRSEFNPSKGYEYSDLGYYFAKPIIEKLGEKPLDEYVYDNIYKPMGLSHMRYTPYKYFALEKLVPTEFDKDFRNQLVHGHVHDPGAAMLGGIGGHAGIFSNATDLCALMQMTLNGGTYAGIRYLDKAVVDEYIGCQFCPTSRRGAGFDRQTNTGQGGPMGSLASNKTYGHTGFTGTCAWVDPQHEIVFIFLSNRVYPDATNWKIRSMNIRSQIQDEIYKAVH
jgi:beta-N-acetylhexosaminidase